jgi:hypothetical protein
MPRRTFRKKTNLEQKEGRAIERRVNAILGYDFRVQSEPRWYPGQKVGALFTVRSKRKPLISVDVYGQTFTLISPNQRRFWSAPGAGLQKWRELYSYKPRTFRFSGATGKLTTCRVLYLVELVELIRCYIRAIAYVCELESEPFPDWIVEMATTSFEFHRHEVSRRDPFTHDAPIDDTLGKWAREEVESIGDSPGMVDEVLFNQEIDSED